ncbi:MAG: hypothetical protein AB1571_02665 [Nanoarchaeota archaeon]
MVKRRIPLGNGCSVKTVIDKELSNGDRIILPGGFDLPILCFRFQQDGNSLKLIHTDKLGEKINEIDISSEVKSINIKYYVKIKTKYHFMHEIVRSFEIPYKFNQKDIFDYLLKKQLESEHMSKPIFETADVISFALQ